MSFDTVSFEHDDPAAERGEVAQWLVRALQAAHPLAPPCIVEIPASGVVRLGRGSSPPVEVPSDAGVSVRFETDDERISSEHARVVSNDGSVVISDDQSKNGTFVNGTRVATRTLEDGDCVEIGESIFFFRRVRTQANVDALRLAAQAEPQALRTTNAEFCVGLDRLRRVAAAPISVLLRGETGTGKELTARAIHALSGRAGAFVPINCGALPSALLESQLFGFKKGAFSGADHDAEGLLRAADRGTVFLDEIAELPEAGQVALLRVLQDGEVLPVGATASLPTDVRVIAATHQDLPARIRDGAFREDLYARLAGAVFELPPLRERLEDLGVLVAAMLQSLAGEQASSLRLSRDAARSLVRYAWPRNMRELHAALELAIAVSPGTELRLEHLPPELATRTAVSPTPPADADSAAVVRQALQIEAGNVSAAARRAGYSRAHFNRLLKRFGLDPAEFRAR